MRYTHIESFLCSGLTKLLIVIHSIGPQIHQGVFSFTRQHGLLTCHEVTHDYTVEADYPEIVILNGLSFLNSSEPNMFVNGVSIESFLEERPLASVLFDISEIPDVGKSTIDMAKKIANSESRRMVKIAHYRVGRFADESEVFWNSYIPILLDASSLDNQRCSCSNYSCFKDDALSIQQRKPLILGGDGERRINLFNILYTKNILEDSLWSLSKPENCDPQKLPICNVLPHLLDRKLEGANAGENKDVTFPERYLYDQTGYSIVFESLVKVEDAYPAFFTEKIFKPIYNAHPFLHICAGKVWSTLKDLKFKSLKPLINPDGLHVRNSKECLTESYAMKIKTQMDEIANASAAKWKKTQMRAAYNKYHFVCELNDILKHKMRLLWKSLMEPLRFLRKNANS